MARKTVGSQEPLRWKDCFAQWSRTATGPFLVGGRTAISRLGELLSRPTTRTATIVTAVFAIDCLTPPGIAVGALYMAAVLSAVPIRHPGAVKLTAGVCSLLVLVGWISSPGGDQAEWSKVLANRALSLGVIGAAAGMANLGNRLQQRRSRQVLESRLLHQATALSASQLSFREALKNSLKALCDIAGWPVGHVYLRDSNGHYLTASDVWYPPEDQGYALLRAATRGVRFAQGEGAAGQAWSSGEPLAVPDISKSPDYAWLKEPERLGIAGSFVLPVTMSGKVAAVMEFFSEQPIHADAEFMPLARNVGEQLGRLFERRKAEHNLRQSEERLRLALQGGRMGTWEWRMDTGQVLVSSPEFEVIYGLPAGSFEGTIEALHREVHPEDRQRFSEAIEQALKEEGEYRVEYRLSRPNGAVRWLEGRGAVHTDAEGHSRRVVSLCMDITERKEFEEKNARLAAIVQSSDEAIFAKSLEGTILTWNPGAERIYGYRPAEVIGRPINFLAPEDRQEELSGIMERIARGEHIDHFETVRRRKDGEMIDVSISISPITNSEGVIIGAATVGRDITHRRKVEREMQEAREKAEKASRLQSRFLANMSHELRTPMNSILGMLQLSLGGKLTDETRNWLTTAQSSAGSLLALLNDLLDLSKIDAGKLAMQSEPYSIRDALDVTIRSVAPKAFEKGLELVCDVGTDVPEQIMGDVYRLRQVLANLVTNAVKFTEHGEVVFRVDGDRGADGTVIHFAVSDTGTGISTEDQTRIFEPFAQSDQVAERQQGGAGLGLSISRELVRRMGGELEVDSVPGAGSRFSFSIPVQIASAQSVAEAASDASPELNGMRALILDENATSREVLARCLERWSVISDLAVDIDHALGKLFRTEAHGHTFHLLLCDSAVADRYGGTLAERLAGMRGDAPAVILMRRPGRDRTALGDGVSGLLPFVRSSVEKPVSPTRLLAAVKQALGWECPDASSQSGSKSSQPAARPLSVLLAEDTQANQQVLASVLRRRGHQIAIANNGREAICLIEQERYDVVLMDVSMPVMDGFEATRIIREHEHEKDDGGRVPIIALTAHAMQGDREKCLACGMDAYLSKPIDLDQLLDLVEGMGDKSPTAYSSAGQFKHSADRPEGGPANSQNDAGTEQDDIADTDSAASWNIEEIINYRHALDRLGGDHTLFRDLVRLFDEDSPALLQAIHTAIEEADAARLQRAAHSLGGLAANFGAKGAVERARQLERLGKSGCGDGVQAAVAHLEREIARLIRALAPYRGTNDRVRV